jgi:type IV pilus assembly protein PilQ
MKYLCFMLIFMAFSGMAQVQDPFDAYQIEISVDQSQLTLHAKEVPVAVILERVANALGKNIIVQDEMDHVVTLHLNRVPIHNILISLCDTFHLKAVQHAGYMWVGNQSDENAYTLTQVFPLKYSQAKALQKVFDDKNVRVDERINALIITDDPQRLVEAETLINALDVPVKQIFIQARILNASKGFSKSLGMNVAAQHNENSLGIHHVDAHPFQITLNTLTGAVSLDARIAAAEKDNQTEVLAMPKILTADQQKATIKQGKELAYEETSTSGATSVRFKEAVLELNVTPHITPDHDIILDLHVKHDVIGKLADNGQPTIDTQAINTQVRLHDGETIVLGGIYSNRHLHHQTGVPLLSRIPLLGNLFKHRYRETDKNELLVFVTPMIIEE